MIAAARDRRRSALAAFGWLERRVTEPLVPLGLFRMRTFAVSSLAAL